MKILAKLIPLFLASLTFVTPCLAEVEASATEYQVKAAFLVNFIKFIEWPGNSAEKKLCIFGTNPFEGNLEALAHKASGISIEQIASGAPGDIQRCAMAFVSRDAGNLAVDLFRKLDLLPTVVITEEDARGDINLLLIEGKVKFQIQQTRLTKSGVKISSRLLNLALPAPDQHSRVDELAPVREFA